MPTACVHYVLLADMAPLSSPTEYKVRKRFAREQREMDKHAKDGLERVAGLAMLQVFAVISSSCCIV